MRFRLRCLRLGLCGLLRPGRLPLSTCFHLLFMPMESTRYFEFEFVWQVLAQRPLKRYLDVSSPRLLPLLLLQLRKPAAADLINPNPRDLAQTRQLVDLIGAGQRCALHGCRIDQAPFTEGSFDAITSISVVEHIPDDVDAVRRMWALLRPGGTLVLTVPCMAHASEQYIDRDEWGVLGRDCDGYVFWQRFYDLALLEKNIFALTGLPRHIVVFGEKTAGSMSANSMRKRADPEYPYWREPYMMATEFRYFDNVSDLPGEGVAGLVFVKPA